MKKFLRIFIVLLVVVFIGTIYVNAENTKISLVPTTTNVKVGKTVDVKINVNCDTSFEGLTGKLTYDKTKLELVKTTNKQGFNDMNAEDAQGNYIVTVLPNSNATITSGTCQTLTFKILEKVNNKEKITVQLKADIKDGKEKVENLIIETSVVVDEDINVQSNNYNVDTNQKHIRKINPNTTVQDLKKNLTTNATEVRLYKNAKELKDSDVVGTNVTINLKNNYDEKTYTLIVSGDVDENGTADFWDMLAINKHRLKTEELGVIESLAGDVTGDGTADFWDMIQINKYRLGLISTL